MIKNLTIISLLAFGLTGCSAKKEISYLTQEEANSTRTQHMTPVPAKGLYTIKVFVKYKELLAEKSIELVIN